MNSYVCTYCGTETSAPQRPGSVWIAAALLFPFVFPALAYSAWRLTSKRLVCPICGHAQLIPADAPMARVWRSAGWLTAPGASVNAMPDARLERIEQAIDAIALEVDRVAQIQRNPSAEAPRLGASRSPY
jgi:DNA-directed RNA polymerase subunit RPC12/RpoP